MLPFASPYGQDPKVPFWGPPTSRANFCEEDYIVSSYIAEFINALTNTIYGSSDPNHGWAPIDLNLQDTVAYAFHRLNYLNSKGTSLTTKLPYIGLALVGLCSGVFHALLKYHAQMMDDLSMLLATVFVVHRVATFDKTSAARKNTAFVLAAVLLPISVYHCVTDEEIGHAATFAAMILYVGYKTRQLVRTRTKKGEGRQRMYALTRVGAGCFVVGYSLWQIDFFFCKQLTGLKRRLGLPYGFLLELHGWWHILTGVGAYIFMALVEFLTRGELMGGDAGFAWPVSEYLSRDSFRKAMQDYIRSRLN